MLPFDWLIHSSLILASCQKILDFDFLPVYGIKYGYSSASYQKEVP